MSLALTRRRWVTPEALNVAPQWLGHALASPRRRLAAIGIDLLLIALLSALANVWLVAALALAAHGITRARRSNTATPRGWLLPVVVVVLLALGAVDAWRERVVVPRPSAAADEADSADPSAGAPDTTASGAAAAAPADRARAAAQAEAQAAAAVARRVQALQDEVERLRAAPPDWRHKTAAWLEDFGLGYGGALLYFTLVPLLWPGQTVGKKLLGLRVVELTGRPMTALLALKRFGGYMAGLATGGIGLAQMLWDHNAQALQDKAAQTLVIDLRQPARDTSIASP